MVLFLEADKNRQDEGGLGGDVTDSRWKTWKCVTNFLGHHDKFSVRHLLDSCSFKRRYAQRVIKSLRVTAAVSII